MQQGAEPFKISQWTVPRTIITKSSQEPRAYHLWLGLGTLGAGFLLATPLTLIIGATAYALG